MGVLCLFLVGAAFTGMCNYRRPNFGVSFFWLALACLLLQIGSRPFEAMFEMIAQDSAPIRNFYFPLGVFSSFFCWVMSFAHLERSSPKTESEEAADKFPNTRLQVEVKESERRHHMGGPPGGPE